MNRRVSVRWTKTAMDGLAKLPQDARRGLIDKADALAQCEDPRAAGKPLTGPLQGAYRIRHSRYRAIYIVDEQMVAGERVVNITVTFILAGIRKGRAKEDIYQFAEKLLRMTRLGVDDLGKRKDPQ